MMSQTVPASPHETPGVLQSLRQMFCDWKDVQRSGARHGHVSLQYPPGHASPVRHVGRPLLAPAAHSPSHRHGAPIGLVPALTQKPRSVPPPHAAGAGQKRHSAFGTPVVAQRSAVVPAQKPFRQHWPSVQVEQVGRATQRPEDLQMVEGSQR